MATIQPQKVPTHLWVVGAISLLWNLYGAYDYLMSVTRNEAYLANFPPEMVPMLDAFPTWVSAAWAIGVWFSVLGSILLLARRALAAPAFLVSFVGALVSFLYQLTIEMPPALAGIEYKIARVVIMIAILAQCFYARRMTNAEVLR